MKQLLMVVLLFTMELVAAEQKESIADAESTKQKTTTIEPIGTEKSTIDMINKIIKKNQSLSVKIGHPLLPSKMTLWQQRGLVRYPTKLTPWVTFKKDIYQFGSYMHELLAKDPQSNNYYHIERLRKNHGLYKALENIQKSLAQYEPKIENTQPLKLSKESLESLQKLINIYGTQFYQDKLLEQIVALLKSFDADAKAIRTEQEQQQKKAQQGDRTRYDWQSFDDTEFNEPLDIDFELESLGFDNDFASSFFD